jgi:hypothetical protein
MALESHNSQRSADRDIIREAYRALANVRNPTLACAQGRCGSASGGGLRDSVGCATAGKISHRARCPDNRTAPHCCNVQPEGRLGRRSSLVGTPENLCQEAGAANAMARRANYS